MSVHKRKRPFGVNAIIGIQLLRVLLFSIGVFLLYRSDLDLEERLKLSLRDEQYILVTYVIAMMGIVTAYGLWRLRQWAWVGVMIQLGLTMLIDLLAYAFAPANYIFVSMLLNVLQVFYLNQGEVQQVFQPIPAFSSLRRRIVKEAETKTAPPEPAAYE